MYRVVLSNQKTGESKTVVIDVKSYTSALLASKRYVKDPKNWKAVVVTNLDTKETK